MMEVEDVDGEKRAYFWVNAHPEMRHEGRNIQEGQEDEEDEVALDLDWVETTSFVTRHELGLYTRES
jgi:hypothetical protein